MNDEGQPSWLERGKRPQAHVLPVSTDPTLGKSYVTLAVNKTIAQWPEGSNAITLLGGRSLAGEDPEEAAARETYEETAGAIVIHQGDDCRRKLSRRVRDFAQRLRSMQYLLRLDRGDQCCFVVNVPWDPHCVAHFGHARSLLSALASSIRQQRESRSSQELLCRDISLTRGERQALIPQGSPDRRLQRHKWLLSHAAVVRGPRRGNGERTIVRDVKREFLEKQKLLILSFPQARIALSRNGRHVDAEGNLLWMTPETCSVLRSALDSLV